MNQPFRTRSGGRIDRAQPIRFSFDGRILEGFAGDTLASALIANGIHLVGRSFKYHRPRGIMAAGSEDPCALVEVSRGPGRATPNLRATQIEIYEGLEATSQNRWPSLAFDLGEINDVASPLLSAGFYYKTFIGPRGAWTNLYEPLIRRAAGLGRAPRAPDPDRYANLFAHCDVLVVGAGPAGIAAALAAAADGARVFLCDEQNELGGCLLHESSALINGAKAQDWLAGSLRELGRMNNVTLLPRTQAFGYFAQNFLGLAERITDHVHEPDPSLPRERLWQVRAREVILATGALERPLVYPENDRPGIMLAESARIFCNRFGAKPGARALVAAAHDSAYRAAVDLHSAGVEIAMIADLRHKAEGPWPSAARKIGLRVETDTAVTGTRGHLRVAAASIGKITGGRIAPSQEIACDVLLMSGGWTPSIHLFSQSRGKQSFNEGLQAFVPMTSAQRERSAGACKGTFGLEGVIAEGFAAGSAAAAACCGRSAPVRAGRAGSAPERATPVAASDLARGQSASNAPVRTVNVSNAPEMEGGFLGLVPHGRDPAKVKAFVDFQNDVTAKDITLATREGFRSIEHVKRYTTTGMATDQGKTSNMNALAIASEATGKPIPAIGLTTFRQPYTPLTFGTLAGASRGMLFDPVRETPIHSWAVEKGAAFEDVGMWKRAWYFANSGEDQHAAVARECRITRRSAGLFDASTLGKIEVVGPDAAEFLNRIYTNAWTKLDPGRCRYGLMLNESGFVMDDGVVGRVAQDRFHVTTTTGGAPSVLAHMEDYLQTEFTDLKVWLTSVTEQWAVIAVNGPNARKILEPLMTDIDISREAMPHMSVREGHVCGVPARLFRVSFTGELGFEVNVPADYGRAVWEAVWAQAQKFEAAPYGTEAMHVMRAEKGYIIVGQETDGTVTPSDLGLDWAIGKAKRDFIGKRSLSRPDIVAKGRKQLVGLLTEDPKIVLEEGAQITYESQPKTGARSLGHVTSAYWSETLERSIAMALVVSGRDRLGESLTVPMPHGGIPVRLVEPVFFDKEGKRLNV